MKKCPKCNAEHDDSDICCRNCGIDLVNVTDGGTPSAENPLPVEVGDIVQEGLGDCKCLKVSINYNSPVIAGYNSAVQLKIEKLLDDLERVELYWALRDNGDMDRIRINQTLQINTPRRIVKNFTEKNSGTCEASFFFLCRMRGGEIRRYMFNHPITIYSKDQEQQNGNYMFYIENRQQASEAGYIRDNTINIDVPDPHGGKRSLTQNELLDWFKMHEQYGSKALSVVDDREFEKEVERESPPPRETPSPSRETPPPPPLTRLLLIAGSQRICVFGKSEVLLGRKKALNDIQIHNPQENIEQEKYRAVSGQHGRLVVNDLSGIRYEDNSANGTQIDHGLVLMHRGCSLPLDRKTAIKVCWLDMELQPQVSDDGKTVCSFLLTRCDGLAESYLVVPHHCRLGEFFPGMEGYTLFFQNGGFSLATPNGERKALCPPDTLNVNGIPIGIRDFEQM